MKIQHKIKKYLTCGCCCAKKENHAIWAETEQRATAKFTNIEQKDPKDFYKD